MSTRSRYLLIAAALVLSISAFVIQEWSLTRYGLVLDIPEWLWIQIAVGWAFLVAGLATDRLRPDTRMGGWMVLFGMIWIGRLVFIAPLIQWEAIGWGFALYGLLFAVILAFPTGRLKGWARRAAGIWMAFILVTAVVVVAFTDFYGFVDDPVCCPSHLLLVADEPDIARAIATPALALASIAFLVVISIQVGRWFRATRLGRRTLSSVAVILVPFFLILVLVPVTRLATGGLADLTEAFWSNLGVLSPTPQPSRLNMYVQNGALLALPGLILFGLLGTRLSRARVADMMQTISPSSTPQELEDHLRNALADPDARLAFLRSEGDDHVDVAGKPVDVAATEVMTSLDERVSVIHDPALDRDLVLAAGTGARLAINNARLQAELRAQLLEVQESRRRLVTATDEARRRVERDLHDGAQQRLIALSATLKEAVGRTPEADPEVDGLLAAAAQETEVAISELRELARGVHPAILTQAGLGPAISSLADRAPMPVSVDVPALRYSAEVEATVYFVVAEALANAFKHAGAKTATVRVSDEDDSVVVHVEDDGVGGADSTGSGLRGLQDRVGSHGGTLRVEPGEDGGTVVTAWLPLSGDGL